MQESFLKENQPKISIIIPVYNNQKYLTRCIKSVIEQTYRNIEIIIINDGSTDKSIDIINKILVKDNRIILIDKENEGVSKTRNYGLRKSTGDYIMFLDSDDYIEKNTINDLVDIIKKNKRVDLIKFGYDTRIGFYVKNKQDYDYLNNKRWRKEQYKRDIYPKIISTYNFSAIFNCLINKKISKDIGLFFNEKFDYAEDLEYQFRLLLASDSIYITNNIYYHYMQNMNSSIFSLNINKFVKQLECEIEIVTEICSEIGFWIDGYNRINKKIYQIIYDILVLSKNYEDYIKMANSFINNNRYQEFIKNIEGCDQKTIYNYIVKENKYWILKCFRKLKRKIKNSMSYFLV